MYDVVAHKAHSFRPDQYKVSVLLRDKEIGSLEGEFIRPFLDRSRIEVTDRARIAFDALYMPERIRLLNVVAPLADSDPSTWNPQTAARLDQVSNLYVVRVSPQLRAIILPKVDGTIQLIDLVRKETLKQFQTGREARNSDERP